MTRIIKATLEGLATAAEIVAKGGLICYPTDTVYGLGCDPLNASAVERVLQVKGARSKPMPVLVKGLDDAERLAQVSVKARRLAEKFWPGPLTIIFPALKILPRRLVPNDTVGLRSPNHPICLNLLGLCSGALVGTSANLTGQPPAISADQASRDLGGRVELVLDGGPTPMGIASTVVDLTKPKVRIIREGPIGKTDIMKCLRAT